MIARTGKPMLGGTGAIGMLHIFITNRFDDHHPGCTGRPVAGDEARIVDAGMQELPRGESGRLAMRGLTGCRYLANPWQGSSIATFRTTEAVMVPCTYQRRVIFGDALPKTATGQIQRVRLRT